MTQWVNSSTGLSTHGTWWWYKIKKHKIILWSSQASSLISAGCFAELWTSSTTSATTLSGTHAHGGKWRGLVALFLSPSIYLYGKLLLLLINYWYNDTLLRRLSSYLHRTWVRLRVREESQWQTTRDASKATMDGVESSCLLSMWGPLWDNHSHTWHSTCLAEVLGAA